MHKFVKSENKVMERIDPRVKRTKKMFQLIPLHIGILKVLGLEVEA